MPDCCAAADCKQSSDQRNVSFFRFPLDPERCKQWVGNCRRPDLQTKTPEYLHRNFKLCSRHFETSLIQKESELKTVLKDGAIPTIFDFTTKKGNATAQNSNRKRKIQATAAEPLEAKKVKDDAQPETVAQNVIEDSTENAVEQEPAPVRPEKEDPATSKAKETLKSHFKETLAFTGFSIVNNVAASATKTMGGGAVGPLMVNPICAEKIDPKDVLRLGEDVMREEIRNSLRMARFFSILLQDKMNIEGKDQIPVFIRSVSNDGFPQKHLLGFLPCDVDSDSLYLMLMSEIRNKWGLRMEHCRGFTYLTTGSLCQKLKEFSCRMLRDFPQVVLAPSDPYAFNMWLIRALPVLSVQDVVDTVEEVAAVLRQSDTLVKKLHLKITAAYSHIKGEVDRVKESCQNNWEYGTDAFQTMLDILEPLLNSIGEMCTSALSEVDTTVMEQLLKLKEKLKNFNFIITLVILKNTLCCVSILNPSLRGIISISSTLQYTISNALKLLNKHLQEIPIFHRKWFSDAVGRAKKLGVLVTLPADTATNGDSDSKTPTSPEDYYRETLSKMVLQYLIDEVKRVLGIEMVRILRWLSLVPSYMADHNFSIRKDKVADANLNNLARPDSFYDELGCWEVKWRHASKRRILPTGVFATLKIPDIGFYPNVQSLLRVLGSIPCINADADVYVQYDMVLDRYRSYMKVMPAEKRLCNMAFIYVNQDVHFNIDDMVQSYVESHPDILQLLCKDDVMEVQPSATENSTNDASKEDMEEPREIMLDMELERPKPAECSGTDKEALKSALKAALTAACNSHSRQFQGGPEGEVEYVTKSEMNEVLKVCADVVKDGILSEAGNSFFSLFVDRVVRFGETDFLPLFLRFVDSFDVMHLELMGFVEANLDTEAMCERLFDIVTKEWHLDFKYCRGQAYLGSGEISYKLKAFACKVQEKYPLAICTHSSCYSFNTWWSMTVPVPSISRALDILEKIVLFFSSSPELEKQLDQVIAVGLRESYEKIHEFQGNFCSSWQEKHDSYDVFSQILEPLVDCLERFHNSSPPMWSLAIINQAKKLLQLIRDFDFIVAIVALKNISSFTRELSAALQKDHFSAASQLCQISGIVATLNRLKTNIKVFHQNWFDEACSFAQNLGVQVKVPESAPCPRDSLLKPGGYYKDAVSVPLVDHIINSVKDHFSDDHKEALNFLSLVPCSVTMSYTFESLKSKPPLYVGDLPDPENFFTELSCWKVKWKTKVVSPTIPDTIFQTLRLPLMQYFANINTLLKIMSVLPSTTLEHCGEVKRHKMFQDYLRSTYAKDRTPCLAMLQVGTNFNRDLDRMVTQCLKVTPQTLEGICLDKEAKTLRNSEIKAEDNHNDEEMEVQQERSTKKLPDFNELKAEDNRTAVFNKTETQQVPEVVPAVLLEGQQAKPLDENGHSDQPVDSLQRVFMVAARLARKKHLFSALPKEEQDFVMQDLGMCHWDQENTKHFSDVLDSIAKSIRETILSEVQESPFFSIITDKVVSVDDKKHFPVFVRYVDNFTPKVELLGFLPLDSSADAATQAKTLSSILSDEWGLQMGCCRGQSFMCMGAGGQGLRKLSLDFLASFPLAVNTPSESCGLAYWLAVSLHNDPIAKVLGVVEDLLLFFDQSPRLHVELSQTREGLLNTPREALAEVPETCLSKWKKREDFFDILVDMLEGVLSCLDSVSNNADGSWSNSMSIHALMLSTTIRESDFVVSLVILKNACTPLRNCSTIFRCGNPADIICELEKIPVIIESLVKMLENINVVHYTWFEEATQLAAKVAGALSYPDTVSTYDSPEVGYRETVSIPVLSGLIEEMKFNFSECHLKALRVLSLLPTCNPLPILPEAPDKFYTIYQSDLPEPEAAEEEINAWATVWREKYQDSSLPTSISETLHHPEAKDHPNVTTLLRLVAVLPSISMECDLMKTTLNSLRSLIGNDYDSINKTNTVMLLMHCPMLQTLEQVIDRCMELDAKSRGFLSPVKESLCVVKMDSAVAGVLSEENVNITNSGVSEIINGTVPISAQDQPTTTVQCDTGEISTSVVVGTTATPRDSAMEITASNGQAEIQETSPISTDGQSAATHSNDSEIGSSTVTASDRTPVEQDIPKEHKALSPGITTELQNGNAELLNEVPAQNITTEHKTASKDVAMALMDPRTKVAAEAVITVSEVADQSAEPVTVEPVAAAGNATMEVTEVVQDIITKPGVEAYAIETLASAQDVIPDLGTAEDVSMDCTVPVIGAAAKDDVTEQSVNMEPVPEAAAPIANTEPVTVSKDVPNDSTVATDVVTALPVRGDKDVTDHEAVEKGVMSVSDMAVESGTKSAPQGVAAKEQSTAVHDKSTNPVVVPQEITMELVATGQDAKGIRTESGVGVQIVTAAQSVTREPVTSAQSVTIKPDTAGEDLLNECDSAVTQYATTKSGSAVQNDAPDHGTTSEASPTEPQTNQGVTPSNEPTTSLEVTVKPVTLLQDISSETNTAEDISSVTASEAQIFPIAELQNVTIQPVTTRHDVTLDDQCGSTEPKTALPDATNCTATVQCGESDTTEQEVIAKHVPADKDAAMDTTESDHGVALQSALTAKDTVPTESASEHVPMELDAASEKITTDPAGTVQDVVMESQDESKAVACDVTMEPITETKDVPVGHIDNLKTETESTGLKVDVQDTSNPVIASAQNGTCHSKIPASDGIDKAVSANKVSDVQSTASSKDATSVANSFTEAEVKHTTVQDDLNQSYAITQDGTDPSKEVAQAAVEDGTEPHKGVLSFYSNPTQEAFFSEIQSAKFFSIICEQQIEIEGHTYIPVGICYLQKQKTPCEDVLAYVPLDQDIAAFVDSMTAALSEKWGLNLAFCRGQNLLTVGAAGAQVRAAATLLSQRYPHAIRTFSSTMSLNTWLAKSCIISEIADSFTWVERMLQWVTEDEEKRSVLHKMVASLFQHNAVKHSDLTDRLSRSQWERSHDTLDLTVEILEAIMLTLNDIKDSHDIQAERTQAGDFLIILQNFEFILTLVIMKNVLGPTKSLSQNLQGQPLDVYQAVTSLTEVLSTLSDMKANIDTHLQTWYQEAVEFASKLQISVDHTSQECLIIYCRDIVSKGAIDHAVCEISELCSDHALSAVRCMQVVPYVISKKEGCCMESEVFKLYQDDLPDSSALQVELLKWRERWLDTDEQPLPAGLLDTLNATDAEFFPNIETLLRLLVILPCFRKEDLIRQGKKSLIEFNHQRSLLELYPL
ncbi:uncharacterized protein si:dkey-250d21.1 isoform X2 [Hemibagrus wyckioides]|uniref:uncharacterized protein si:dkey-250d21.1 isoform X2 n=1 Tax=Hemibagrus wyckioides TaxID=337641 RepID=UPI00266BED2A|nr:uncharacterized protein si:dkey-250d21.1 isoform X2 [Hemibagrus wyckioides]